MSTPYLWDGPQVSVALGVPIPPSTWSAHHLSIDSRDIVPGSLFIALKGQHNDGHAFLADAFHQGASAAIVQDIPSQLPLKLHPQLVFVPSTFKALWQLAAYRRSQCQGKVIAITGSVGKTSTRDGLAHLLKYFGLTQGSTKNYNNHYGVPLSLGRLSLDTAFVVIEAGISEPGEMLPLSQLIAPDIAIITSIAPCHLESLSSLETVAYEKGCVMKHLRGPAILPADSPFYPHLLAQAKKYGIEQIISFGYASYADIRLQEVTSIHPWRTQVQAVVYDKPVCYTLNQAPFWAPNSAAILATLVALDLPFQEVLPLFDSLALPQGRGQPTFLPWGEGQITVLDDSYNASPASVEAALKNLLSIPAPRRIAVLADMKELGASSLEYHQHILRLSKSLEGLIVYGPLMKEAASFIKLPHLLGVFDTPSQATDLLKHVLKAQDVVLIKGSRSMQGDKIVQALSLVS